MAGQFLVTRPEDGQSCSCLSNLYFSASVAQLSFSVPISMGCCSFCGDSLLGSFWCGSYALTCSLNIQLLEQCRSQEKEAHLQRRPWCAGVLGETPQIFPAASDYHLVCLQHDDSAEMIIDGELTC